MFSPSALLKLLTNPGLPGLRPLLHSPVVLHAQPQLLVSRGGLSVPPAHFDQESKDEW